MVTNRRNCSAHSNLLIQAAGLVVNWWGKSRGTGSIVPWGRCWVSISFFSIHLIMAHKLQKYFFLFWACVMLDDILWWGQAKKDKDKDITIELRYLKLDFAHLNLGICKLKFEWTAIWNWGADRLYIYTPLEVAKCGKVGMGISSGVLWLVYIIMSRLVPNLHHNMCVVLWCRLGTNLIFSLFSSFASPLCHIFLLLLISFSNS
jgi:hypothetical protein